MGEHLKKHALNAASLGQGLFITPTSARFTRDQLRHLQSRLGALALPDVAVSLAETGLRRMTSKMTEEQHALAESFLRTILQLLPLIRYGQFETAA